MSASDRQQGRNGSIFTKRRQKSGNRSRDGGGKQMKRRGTWGSVHCEIHGIQPADGKGFKSVRTPIATTRRERFSGCPKCKE